MKTSLRFVGRLSDFDRSALLSRGEVPAGVKETVASVFSEVKKRGVPAVLEFTKRFDGPEVDPNSLRVTDEELKAAYSKISAEQLNAIQEAKKRLIEFCLEQKKCVRDSVLSTEDGTMALKWLPLKRVGIYAPAGRAPLPSSVIMSAVPARVAGVEELVLCSPPQKDGSVHSAVLVAASECGIDEVYRLGGAQAIAAMAYGSGFAPVDMICGPGNAYVAYAKQLAASEGLVKIDTIAGPSEVLIIADETADSRQVASDMLAQAEHGPTSAAICVALSPPVGDAVSSELERQFASFKEKEPMASSLKKLGCILITESLEEAVTFANDFAAEHVEVFTKDAEAVAKRIPNAGAVFVRTGEVFGDYGMSGGNHILPTGRAARFASPVSVYSFLRQQQVESMTKGAQERLSTAAVSFARLETLEAHARSAETRSPTRE